MKTLEELRARFAELQTSIRSLSEKESVTPEDDSRLDTELSEFDEVRSQIKVLEDRSRRIADANAATTETSPGFDTPNVIRKSDPFAGDVRSSSRPELRDRALRALEQEGKRLAPAQQDHLDKLLRTNSDNLDGSIIARRLLTTETEHYRSAFIKSVTQSSPAYLPEEARAIAEYRAANEGTGSAGGFGVPVLIDPTIILTSGAADAPILSISKMVTITTDAWKGVSSAGVTWSYDAEASVVSDDSPTLAQPDIPVYAARGFIPYSIELGQDYPGFADEMSMLLNQGYIDLVASQTMTGSGSASPTGIFTAMQNTTTNPAHILVTTKGAFGSVDVRAAWAALPERFRSKATWVMSVSVSNAITNVATALSLGDYTATPIADGSSVLTGRPIVLSDYAPTFTGTTGAVNIAVVGDFSNFLIVQRAGMTVELVQNLFDTSTGRPTGQRGWFAFARHGFDAVNHNAFRLISNT